jgi:arabinogalactan endo-1,4-beta-galactosidase
MFRSRAIGLVTVASVAAMAPACGMQDGGLPSDGGASADGAGSSDATGLLDGASQDANGSETSSVGVGDASTPADTGSSDSPVTSADATPPTEGGSTAIDASGAEEGTLTEAGPMDASGQHDAAAPDTWSTDAAKDATPKDAPSGADAAAASFFLGADVSFVQQEEDEGRKFYDVDGTEKDIFAILKAHGFTTIRLRTFVDPTASDGYDTANGTTTAYCDTAHTVTMGARVKAAGMQLVLDFHMSDTWADPGHQVTPLAWQGYSITQLTTAVQTYTNGVITQMVAGNARPDIVQVGNEITPGMLLPLGSNSTSWTNLGTLLKAGIAGVKAVDSTIKIMMHIDRGGDNATSKWWVTNAMTQGVAFDVLGESCYTNFQGDPSTWQANFADLVTQFPNLSFMIAEYDEDSADLAGNTECAAEGTGPCNVWRRANDIAFNIPNKKGIGTLIWEPTEYEETLFDNQNKALTNDTTNLPNPFGTGARIQLYDQMVTAYGL